jgi:hypothetical protein
MGRPIFNDGIFSDQFSDAGEFFKPVIGDYDSKWSLGLPEQDSTFACTSTRYIWGYVGDPSAANPPRLIAVTANIDAIQGGRWVAADSRFYTDTTGNVTMHPFTISDTPQGKRKVFTEFMDWPASTAVTADQQVAVQTSAGNWCYLTCTTGGTTDATTPTVTDANVAAGTTNIADGATVKWTASGYATLHKGGQVLESAATNITLQSEALNVTWTTVNATIDNDAAVAPDGNTTADEIQEDATINQHVVAQTMSFTDTVQYTFSIFLKAADRDKAYIQAGGGSFPGAAADRQVWFDLTGFGAVGTTGASWDDATITFWGNGWYRCTATITADATGADNFFAGPTTADGTASYQGVAGNGIYGWGGQTETGGFASSYIKTTTGTVTRAATTLSDTTAGRLTSASGAGRIVFTPNFGDTDLTYLLQSSTDGNNVLSIFNNGGRIWITAKNGGVGTALGQLITPTDGIPLAVEFYYNTSGKGIRVYQVGDSVPVFQTNAETAGAGINTNFYVGSLDPSGSNLGGNYLSVELSDKKEDFGW